MKTVAPVCLLSVLFGCGVVEKIPLKSVATFLPDEFDHLVPLKGSGAKMISPDSLTRIWFSLRQSDKEYTRKISDLYDIVQVELAYLNPQWTPDADWVYRWRIREKRTLEDSPDAFIGLYFTVGQDQEIDCFSGAEEVVLHFLGESLDISGEYTGEPGEPRPELLGEKIRQEFATHGDFMVCAGVISLPNNPPGNLYLEPWLRVTGKKK